MSTHECPQCGLEHGGVLREQTPPEVRIAEINKERDIELARIGRSETKTVAEIEAGAMVETAELDAAAAVAVAEETGPPEAEAEGETMPSSWMAPRSSPSPSPSRRWSREASRSPRRSAGTPVTGVSDRMVNQPNEFRSFRASDLRLIRSEGGNFPRKIGAFRSF